VTNAYNAYKDKIKTEMQEVETGELNRRAN